MSKVRLSLTFSVLSTALFFAFCHCDALPDAEEINDFELGKNVWAEDHNHDDKSNIEETNDSDKEEGEDFDSEDHEEDEGDLPDDQKDWAEDVDDSDDKDYDAALTAKTEINTRGKADPDNAEELQLRFVVEDKENNEIEGLKELKMEDPQRPRRRRGRRRPGQRKRRGGSSGRRGRKKSGGGRRGSRNRRRGPRRGSGGSRRGTKFCGRKPISPRLRCCRSKSFDPRYQSCCQGTLSPKRPSLIYRCCGARNYDIGIFKCCNGGKVVWKFRPCP